MVGGVFTGANSGIATDVLAQASPEFWKFPSPFNTAMSAVTVPLFAAGAIQSKVKLRWLEFA